MKPIFTFLILLTAALGHATERVAALIDQTAYVAGEQMYVAVRVEPVTSQDSAALSRVAYVELCDQQHLCAQAMVALTDGYGWAALSLPATLHSGYYQLTVYTQAQLSQADAPLHCQLVPVINPLLTQRGDQISFAEAERPITPEMTCQASSPLTLCWPEAARDAHLASVTIIGHPLCSAEAESTALTPRQPSTRPRIEAEGHQVHARVVGNHHVVQCMLAAVGKAPHVYAGQQQSDSTWIFYTDGQLTGTLGVALTATDEEGRCIPMDFFSPYERLLPQSLPRLTMHCQPEDLRQRSIAAQQLQAFRSSLPADTLAASPLFLGMEPTYDYKMSEWAKFSTIREIITEFVHGAHRGKDGHRTSLFIFDREANAISTCPALLLLDGVPVYDTDKLLDYDARLLEHVRIYHGRVAMGSQLYFGVISFTTQRGGLSNYKLDAGTRLAAYDFPQQRPALLQYEGQSAGCLTWLPCIPGQRSLQLTAPSRPGIYTLFWQWVGQNGNVDTHTEQLIVR